MTYSKNLYEQKAQAQLEQIALEAKKLRAQAKEASADAGLEIQERLDQLDNKIDQANEQFADFKRAGEKSWEQLKVGIDSSLQNVQDELSQLTEKVKPN